MQTILVCDDERDIVSALQIYLNAEGYRVLEACNGREALAILSHEEVHLVLLDIMMPAMDGLSVLTILRESYNLPVILLTAKSEDTDKVIGLNVGADDYVTKPFNPVELLARVRSQLRRYLRLGGGTVKPAQVQIGGICLDDEAKSVTLEGEKVDLTPREYDILKLLMKMQERSSPLRRSTAVSGRRSLTARKKRWPSTSAICGKSWRSTLPSPVGSRSYGAGGTKWRARTDEEIMQQILGQAGGSAAAAGVSAGHGDLVDRDRGVLQRGCLRRRRRTPPRRRL